MSEQDWPRLTYLVLLLAVLLPALLWRRGGRAPRGPGEMLRNALIWVAVGAALALAWRLFAPA